MSKEIEKALKELIDVSIKENKSYWTSIGYFLLSALVMDSEREVSNILAENAVKQNELHVKAAQKINDEKAKLN